MAISITTVTGIEWYVNKGEVAGEEALNPTPDPNSATGFVNPTEFQWEDATARLIEGPEQLVDFYIQGRAYIDTRTIITDDVTGGVVSDSVARTYPAYVVTEMTLNSDHPADWTDPNNPVKPKQQCGPVLYKQNDLPEGGIAMNGGGYTRVGLSPTNSRTSGFVLTKANLPDFSPNIETFLVDLETGRGYIWVDSRPGAVEYNGSEWTNTGLAKNPDDINTDALDSIDDLPEDAENGTWQLVNNGVYGTVYEKRDDGWFNIGPLQAGGTFPFNMPQPTQVYIGGYIYSLVFDRSDFYYVPRLSGGYQSTYEGEISITETGWFPDQPHDAERNIYPMDSVTKVKPDGRENVTITYTCILRTSVASGACTVIQDVYQPTYDWGDLIQQLLDKTYFAHGIYH